MAVTWTIEDLESDPNGGVVVAHWRASDGQGEHSSSKYGACSLTPDPSSSGYIAFDSLDEAVVVGWVKANVDADQIEANIAAKIERSKEEPQLTHGKPWS